MQILKEDTTQTQAVPLAADTALRIAHPIDLLGANWPAWLRYVMQHQRIQPFKQVFRELYVMTEEERSADGISRRFAGYQVDRSKALGLLSSRGWLHSGEGFEQVRLASNVRIELYTYADWLTAGDVEDPCLEEVVFIDNRTGNTCDMSALDPIVFSETMHDIDLVVSVALILATNTLR